LARLADDGVHVENDPGERAVLSEIRQLRGQGATFLGTAAALNHGAYRTLRGTACRLESVARIPKPGALAAR
jgi:hypothetical protein